MYRDLLLSEEPCSDVEVASLVAGVDCLCLEAKIALLAWMLIVASWVSRRPIPDSDISVLLEEEGEGGSQLTEEDRQQKLLQLMAVATAIMKDKSSSKQQKKQLTKIFKDLKKLSKV